MNKAKIPCTIIFLSIRQQRQNFKSRAQSCGRDLLAKITYCHIECYYIVYTVYGQKTFLESMVKDVIHGLVDARLVLEHTVLFKGTSSVKM